MTDDERRLLTQLAELQRAVLTAQGDQLSALLQLHLAQQRAHDALAHMMRVLEQLTTSGRQDFDTNPKPC